MRQKLSYSPHQSSSLKPRGELEDAAEERNASTSSIPKESIGIELPFSHIRHTSFTPILESNHVQSDPVVINMVDSFTKPSETHVEIISEKNQIKQHPNDYLEDQTESNPTNLMMSVLFSPNSAAIATANTALIGGTTLPIAAAAPTYSDDEIALTKSKPQFSYDSNQFASKQSSTQQQQQQSQNTVSVQLNMSRFAFRRNDASNMYNINSQQQNVPNQSNSLYEPPQQQQYAKFNFYPQLSQSFMPQQQTHVQEQQLEYQQQEMQQQQQSISFKNSLPFDSIPNHHSQARQITIAQMTESAGFGGLNPHSQIVLEKNQPADRKNNKNRGWLHNSFPIELDSSSKKRLYILSRVLDFNFDVNIAKEILTQIQLEAYPREELLQMVIETMLAHKQEMRIGKRVIDAILEHSRFAPQILRGEAEHEKAKLQARTPLQKQYDEIFAATYALAMKGSAAFKASSRRSMAQHSQLPSSHNNNAVNQSRFQQQQTTSPKQQNSSLSSLFPIPMQISKSFRKRDTTATAAQQTKSQLPQPPQLHNHHQQFQNKQISYYQQQFQFPRRTESVVSQQTQQQQQTTFYQMPTITTSIPHHFNNAFSPQSQQQQQLRCSTITSSSVVRVEPVLDASKLYECTICCIEYLGSQFTRASTGCSHVFCGDCIVAYIAARINESDVLDISCPQEACKARVVDQQIECFLSSEEYNRYLMLKKINVINRDPNIRWCLTPGCDTYMRGSKDQSLMQCTKCSELMCFLCAGPYHSGSCDDAMVKRFLDSNSAIKKKSCPSCHSEIFKYQGCNHMQCWWCGYEYCWLCKSEYTKFHYYRWNILGCPDSMNTEEESSNFGLSSICNCVTNVLRFVFLIVFMIAGAAVGFTMYALAMVIVAFFVPTLVMNEFGCLDRVIGHSRIIDVLTRIGCFGIAVITYPVCFLLCFVPGMCILIPEIYLFGQFVFYGEDKYS